MAAKRREIEEDGAASKKTTEFRPCIDLHSGKVKQIVGSTLSDSSKGQAKENFVAPEGQDSAFFARLYKKHGLTGGHVIMLGPGNEEAALAALRAYPQGLQVGGGIKPGNANKYLDAGASHVIVTSYVFRDGKIDRERLKTLVETVGPEHLVLDLSCRVKKDWAAEKGGTDKDDGEAPYYIVTNRWQRFTDTQVTPETLKELAQHCDEFLVHAVDVEGKMCGVDERLLALLGKHSPIPCTYAGGVRDLNDVETVRRLGNGRVHVTIGSALDIFGGPLPFEEVLEAFK